MDQLNQRPKGQSQLRNLWMRNQDVFENDALSALEKLALIYVQQLTYLDLPGEQREKAFGIKAISVSISASRSTTKRVLRSLEDRGYLAVDKRFTRDGGNDASLYQLAQGSEVSNELGLS